MNGISIRSPNLNIYSFGIITGYDYKFIDASGLHTIGYGLNGTCCCEALTITGRSCALACSIISVAKALRSSIVRVRVRPVTPLSMRVLIFVIKIIGFRRGVRNCGVGGVMRHSFIRRKLHFPKRHDGSRTDCRGGRISCGMSTKRIEMGRGHAPLTTIKRIPMALWLSHCLKHWYGIGFSPASGLP